MFMLELTNGEKLFVLFELLDECIVYLIVHANDAIYSKASNEPNDKIPLYMT